MPRLEEAIKMMVELFEEYAGQDNKQISIEELKESLEKDVESPQLKVRD